ncbi:MAG TPA: prolipoprotein diacylglyceryl transferase [Gemmatimonadales bacterium]|nr:prolipoprotein diacylglyceryl transferase [Gemmatimonadales bacterium]
MTVFPFVIHLGSFEVTGYGIMMMVAFLAGSWLIALELRRRGFREEYASDVTLAALVGGIIGAKLWYVALTGDLATLFSRGGLVWYGGFIGGALGVVLNGWRLRVPIRWTAQLVAPALAAAYALGRVGCFIVNDDYGRPTSLPWAMKFPQGLPPSTAGNMTQLFGIPVPPGTDPSTVLAVHPTQLYEIAAMLVVFAILWRWRTLARGTGWLFGAYLVFAGIERFLVEIVRAKDDRFVGPFTLAQVTSVLLVIIGIVVMQRLRNGAPTSPGTYLMATPENTS